MRFRGTFAVNIDNYESLKSMRWEIIALKILLLQFIGGNSPGGSLHQHKQINITPPAK